MLPKIKKKIKMFLMDETGSISKSNIIKGALFLTSAGVAISKVKATTQVGIENPSMTPPAGTAERMGLLYTNNASEVVDLTGITDQNDWAACTHFAEHDKIYKTKTGQLVGCNCNGAGSNIPDGGENGKNATWWCGRQDCGWSCVTSTGDNLCGNHTNDGKAYITSFEGDEHHNGLDFQHDGSTASLIGKHVHHGVHGSWNEMEECPQYEGHTNHCSHSSHGSHNSW